MQYRYRPYDRRCLLFLKILVVTVDTATALFSDMLDKKEAYGFWRTASSFSVHVSE